MIDKVYISYFAQIRNFPENFIPLSTAKYDPKWYHDNRDYHYTYFDKRKVLNGIRLIPFVPKDNLDGLCHGPETCKFNSNPVICDYLNLYSIQINKVNCKTLLEVLEKNLQNIKNAFKIPKVLVPVFIVWETPERSCSERIPIKRYFEMNGITVEEFNKDKI